ncbi:MFS transporter [Roseomonas sp. HJA6]|uniref:MFS transporter n=1 Tax=Roseomonas alba TaxID=2846776 RepID=A0ABS7AIP8_9PROT|nr:MFS transporter [Neoroseomonas alba]MBW6401180.1 MFS transporter [Neoroseomonas alba]
MSEARGIPDRTLFWGMATTQLIGWGTIHVPFPLLVAPIADELGWSRVLINGAYTAGLLAAGLAAVPAGRWLDRHGPRGLMNTGMLGAALLLFAMSLVQHPAAYVAIWILLGLVQAMCLWGTAMAVVVAEARDVRRTVTSITFVTGFTVTVFVPLSGALIDLLGWRGAVQVLALMQLGAAFGTVVMLRDARVPARGVTVRAGPGLRARLKEPAFLGLALCFSAHAFIGMGLGAHLIPLLRARDWPEATVLLIAAAHGPAQVTARMLLFAAGRRVTMRSVGYLASCLVPVGMLALATGPTSLALTAVFVLCWGMGDGLLTIVRTAGAAEILGREGFGAISGALSAITVAPRMAAPLLLALLWEAADGYGPVPWLLAGVGLAVAGGFILAARQPDGGVSAR